MAFDGTDPCWVPEVPVQREDSWRLRIAQFGDGYSQRTLDGINALDMTWSLQWENREQAVINAMVNYLVALKAHSFLYKDQQTGTTWSVFCDRWQVSWNLRRKGPLYYGTLSAEFIKANGLTA